MNSKIPSNPDTYLNFLQLILKTVAQSNRNTQNVYSLLQANLDKLDEFLAHILQDCAFVPVALNQAQRWLRDANGDELQQWMEEPQLPLASTLKISLARQFRQNRLPCQSPFYSAAFCAVGQ